MTIHLFLLIFLTVKEFSITTSSVVEIQNGIANPKSQPIKSNSEHYQFLFKFVSSKNKW